jgi:FkbM family methyltransferase
MIRSDAKSWPPKRYIKLFHKRVLEFRQWLTRDIHISDGQYDYRFRCETVREYSRYLKIFIKEPGTVDWIDQNVRYGDIFYDIGANVGVYTIFAASRTGDKGKVYAFEPHGANFARLIDNITANNLQQIVSPNNFALHNKEGFFPFLYKSDAVGTSDSQLSVSRDVTGVEDVPSICERKYATTIDHLIDSGEIKAPDHIKIDVDGNELLILEGMNRLLSGSHRPKSIQVEMNDPHKPKILKFLNEHQYILIHKHFTRAQSRRKKEGCDPESLGYNAIFRHEG